MSYDDLYCFAQTQGVPVKRNALRDKATEICGIKKISLVRATLDENVCRGFWLTPQNTEHRLVQQIGNHIVVVHRELNRCWERFVYTKEIMHLFDEDDQKAADPASFKKLLSEFETREVEVSKQMVSEISSFWRALGVLCPEEQRQEFLREREETRIDDYEIALRLRIPQQYVHNLFTDRYPRIIEQLR